MQDGFEHWLDVLGLEPGASQQAIKEAYRDLVKVWHPDRFGTDERLRRKAQDTLTDVNAAYEHLRNYRPSSPFAARPARPNSTAPAQPPRSTPWSTDDASRPAPHGAAHPWRMAGTLVVCAAVGSASVWLYLSGRRPTETVTKASEAEQEPPSATRYGAAAAASHGARQESSRSSQAPQGELASAEASAGPSVTTGSLRVDSRPGGGRVSLDGHVIGETPLRVTDLAPGEYQIRIDVDARSYEPWTSTIVVEAGREEKILAVMSRTR